MHALDGGDVVTPRASSQSKNSTARAHSAAGVRIAELAVKNLKKR